MKNLSTFIVLISFLLAFHQGVAFAQEDIYSFMEEHLTSDESAQIDVAKRNIAKGDKMNSQIREEDKKLKKYSKKQKKLEKKATDAKILYIKQALYYDKGYKAVYDVYNEKIANVTFIYEDDEARANDLLEESATDISTAKRKLQTYRNVSPKDLKKKYSYSKVKSDMSSAINLEISAIKKVIEAYSIYLEQEQKRQLEQEEKRVWNNAQSENTILAYQSYLDEYPSGKYASSARQRISDLEEAARLAKEKEEKSRSLSGVIFEVQIAASKKAIPNWQLKRIYKGGEQIKQRNYDGWYKYSVGNFNTYQEAKSFVRSTKVRGAFVVAYKNNQKIDIKEAISGN